MRNLVLTSMVVGVLAGVMGCDSKKPPVPGPKASGGSTPKAKEFSIGIVGRGKDDELSRVGVGAVKWGLDAYAAANGLTLTVRDETPEARSTMAQVTAFDRLSDAVTDGIVAIVDDDGKRMVDDQGRPAEGAGLPIVTYAIDQSRQRGADIYLFFVDSRFSDRLGYIGRDEEAAGEAAGTTVAELLTGRGEAVILAGPQTRLELRTRAEGAAAALGRAGVAVAEIVHHEEGAAAEVFAAARARHGSAMGWVLVAPWDVPLDDLPEAAAVVVIDASTRHLDALEGGAVDALVVGDYGAWGERVAAAILGKLYEGELPDVTEEYDSPMILTRDTVADFRARWDEWLGR